MEKSKNLAPVVMFVYNRADHLKKTYDALSKCQEAKDTDLFIFSDGPKNEKAVSEVNEVRMLLEEIEKKSDFKSINVRASTENKGLAKSIINGVSEIIEEYGKVIVIEDDSVASPYFLSFMNESLNFYENEKNIGAIAGYTPQFDYPSGFKGDVFVSYRSCSCAWATWSDRWKGVDWNLEKVEDFYKNPELIKKLNSNGADRFIRLYRQTKGNGTSWSVRFGAHLVKNNQMTVYPRYSYIENVGCDASGTHSKIEDAEKMMVDMSKAIESPTLILPEMNEEIQKIMKKHYSGGVVSDIKRAVGTAAIICKENIAGGLWKTKG